MVNLPRILAGRRRFLLAAALAALGKILPARAAGDVLADFGGMPGLTALMETFMVNLLADTRTQPFFAPTDQKRVKDKLAEQFCALLGGDCEYRGGNMKGIHRGLGITMEDFNALVEALQDAMDKHGIAFRSQNKLLALLAPMHRDIVEK